MPSATPFDTSTPTPTETPIDPFVIGFDKTRQLLLDTAVEHFDPDRQHLPNQSTNGQSGGYPVSRAGTKLDWTNPGEQGLGMVQVAVTGPDYGASDEYAVADFASRFGCDIEADTCSEQTIPGTDQTVVVAEPHAADETLLLGVVYERADGSFVGVAVHDLFGNNSQVAVSDVDIDLEQAIAFVTDPDLKLDLAEAAEETERQEALTERYNELGEGETTAPVESSEN